MQPNYVTFECCSILIFLYVMSSFRNVFVLHLKAKGIYLALSSPKGTLICYSPNIEGCLQNLHLIVFQFL